MYVVAQTASKNELQSLVLTAMRCVQCTDPACLQQCQLRTDLRCALDPFKPGTWWTQERAQAETFADEAIQASFA